MKRIHIYDTTLRDGSQAEDVNFSLDDKLKVCLKLDELGMDYIEGGWPGSNPTDDAFFKEIQNYSLKCAKIAAFGSTHHPGHTADKDPNLNALLAARTPVITLFGKTWDFHAKEALRVPLERNLELIYDSLAYLKPHVEELIFDAEHFFDGFKANKEYALSALAKAHMAGANVLALCETNGGTMPCDLREIIKTVRKALPNAVLGIHAHNDTDLAVANSIEAVCQGVTQVQGTLNGYGERCGNANLCSIVANLETKFGKKYSCLPKGNLNHLTLAAAYVGEIANVPVFNRQPFVGRSAFAHKGGIHVSAVSRNPALYEHIDPSLVGNSQRVLLTELAGRSNIVHMARNYGFHLDKDEPVVKGLMTEMKEKASQGYDFAAAEASVELMLLRKLAQRGVRNFFKLIKFTVLDCMHHKNQPSSEAMVTVEVEGEVEQTAATGHGPVNALDNALRKALRGFYPRLDEMRLIDFKVRVMQSATKDESGTASVVRVLIESGDLTSRWVTVGVSYNVIQASWEALVDSVTYKLFRDEQESRGKVEKG